MKVVCLLSGGIDSPVAAYMMGDVGAQPVLLHMDNSERTSEGSIEKLKALTRRLESVLDQSITLCKVPHRPNQKAIADSCDRSFQCVLCKRFMLKIATALSQKLGAEAVVTGGSLGQVASQTLENIGAEQSGIDFPILRPLIGLDKLEIEKTAKRIGTYEISIRESCSCPFLPQRPRTRAQVEEIMREEEKLPFERLVRRSVETVEEISL